MSDQVLWNVRTVRHQKTGTLYLAVDSLMDFRNNLGAKGAPDALLGFVDYIIAQARRADEIGEVKE